MGKPGDKIKETHVSLDLYNVDVSLIIGRPDQIIPWARAHIRPERFKDFERHFEDHPITQTQLGRMVGFDGGGAIIWLPSADAEGTLFTFVHEVSHAAYHILKCKGVRLSDDSDEVYAYLVEYIFRQLWRGLNKHKSKP